MESSMESVLVIGATSRQGKYTCQALKATGVYKVFGTTRTVPNAKVADAGVTALACSQGDGEALAKALETSQARYVFIWTDYYVAAKGRKDLEVAHGKAFIDVCAKCEHVRHVVLASVCDCDKCPDNVSHFKAKLDLETHLKQSSIPSWSILRPTAFLENFDDPANWNPLTKGHIKGLWRSNLKVQFVPCEDIGKAATAMFLNSQQWKGRTLDCVSCELTGDELAEALTAASGVPCKYSIAVPSCILNCFMKDLANMVRFLEDPGYSGSIEEFKKVINPIEAKRFFEKLGQWNNGEEFAPAA